jgi:hypothetical protein
MRPRMTLAQLPIFKSKSKQACTTCTNHSLTSPSLAQMLGKWPFAIISQATIWNANILILFIQYDVALATWNHKGLHLHSYLVIFPPPAWDKLVPSNSILSITVMCNPIYSFTHPNCSSKLTNNDEKNLDWLRSWLPFCNLPCLFNQKLMLKSLNQVISDYLSPSWELVRMAFLQPY